MGRTEGARPPRAAPGVLLLIALLLAGYGATQAFRAPYGPWHIVTATAALVALAAGVVLLRQRRSVPVATRLQLAAYGAALLVLAVAAVGVWFAYLRADELVHPGRFPLTRTPETVGITAYETVTFPAADGLTLHGWYVRPSNGAVVILAHGFAANRGELLDDAAMLIRHGYGILLFDLRNSGESDGGVTTFGLLEAGDVRGAVAFVRTLPGGAEARIGLYGHSLGSGAVLLAAPDLPQVQAIVTQSAYTSLEDNIAEGLQQMTGLPPFPFAPLVVFFAERASGARVADVRPVATIGALSPRAVLLVHGAQDNLVDVSNAHRLYAAAGEPKELYIIAGAGHSNLMQAEPQEYERRVATFLDKYLSAPAVAPNPAPR